MTENKRKEKRFPLRLSIQYEKMLTDGKFDIPISTPARDVGLSGISFYSQEKIDINSRLRITICIGEDESITYIAKVARVILSERKEMNYIVGVNIEEISEENSEKIKNFLDRTDIHNVLDNIDLDNVMDIHFVSDYPPVIKKIGRLVIDDRDPFDEYTLRSLLLSMIDEDRYRKFMKEKELNLVFTSRKGTRFRVNLHIQQGKVEGAFRLIPSEVKLPSQLGLPPVVENILRSEKGLILISGRTGSGKTTTLASMVEFLNNQRDGIIICIEDPVEYIHANRKCIIKQREVGRDTLSFSNATRNALRQNPDVLVIGEILNMETMEMAITAAETGALVLSSVHAGNSSQCLDRLTSFFPADLQRHVLTRLSLILRGVIAQELLPRVDQRGLILATEIVVTNSAMRRIIREGDWKQIPSLIQMNRNAGMHSMHESLERLYRNNLINGEYIRGTLESA